MIDNPNILEEEK